MMEIMISHWVGTLIQIGQEVFLTEKALQDVVSVAALYTPLGDVEEIFDPLGVSLGASES